MRWAACAAGGALVAAVAGAEPVGGLAPAGDCAEPRVAVRGEPLGIPAADAGGAAADDGGVAAREPGGVDESPDGFPVTGEPRDHFDPRDVAATRDAGPRSHPPAPPVLERGACDAPGSVCIGAVPRGVGGVIAEPTPGSPGQPGAGPLR
jgi:hypothetical protein